MRIVSNETAYDTRAVRRVVQATVRAFQKSEGSVSWWSSARLHLVEMRRLRNGVRFQMADGEAVFALYFPPLRGTEFIGLARQQHGGDQSIDHGGVTAKGIALALQWALYQLRGRAPSWARDVVVGGEKRTLRGLPLLIPLRIIKPELPRDKLQERLARTLELRKNWQRKAKLAATKLKKLASQQRRYEKQLAKREASI